MAIELFESYTEREMVCQRITGDVDIMTLNNLCFSICDAYMLSADNMEKNNTSK